jgi:tetratricopeptide (TPR) repeat protein
MLQPSSRPLVAGTLILLALGLGVLYAQEPPDPAADALFQRGGAQAAQGRYQEAEDLFRRVIELEPANSRGILAIAQVYLAQKKDDEALRFLQSEAAKAPARRELHLAIGNIALQSAKYDLAVAEFQRILDSIEKNSSAAADLYFRMGEAYRLKGDLDFAVAILRQAQAMQPANLAILNMLAFTLESAGQRQAAGDQYRKILELDPNSGLALNNLAFLLADTGADPPLALAYALRARQLVPNEPTITDTLGWVYLKLNRAEVALPLFQEAVEQDPRRATYRYHLAAALELKGDHVAARRESEAALKSNPTKDEEQKIKELLQQIQ